MALQRSLIVVCACSALLSLVAGRLRADPTAEAGYASLPAATTAARLVSDGLLDPSEPPRPFVDLDEPLATEVPDALWMEPYGQGAWGIHLLPRGFIYKAYLAAPKETRLATHLIRIPDDSNTMWDSTIGARIAVLRIGTNDPVCPQGFQADVESSAQVRLNLSDENDVQGTDYRVGIPLSWGTIRHQWRFGYYHMSSHLGDEFLAKNPGFPRFLQSRDVLIAGYSYYPIDSLRLFAEAGWAFCSNASEPWEFQFGVDCAPRAPTGVWGKPFAAVHAHLRQELDFGGGVSVQAGWAWRSCETIGLLRIGLHYYNGASTRYAFLPFHEQQIGIATWYDF